MVSKKRQLPTAYWKVPALVRSLAVSGWGELAAGEFKGARAMLRALQDYLPDGSGEGRVTAWQIAQTAGYSDRWVRHSLNLLEGMGIIEWTRGGIRQGKPLPSWIRINKHRLVELIKAAKMSLAERRRKHDEERAARLAAAPLNVKGESKRPRVRYNRRSRHAEVAANPPAPKGGGANASPLEEDLLTKADRMKGLALAREHLARMRATSNVHEQALARAHDMKQKKTPVVDIEQARLAQVAALEALMKGVNHG